MNELATVQNIQTQILQIRGKQVMLDRDLAKLYGVKTMVLNQAVKRNIKRFPADFRFQLTKEENANLRSQFVTLDNVDKQSLKSQFVILENQPSGRGKYSKYLPYAFTEQGVAMLSAVLKSEIAIRVSIQIMQAFVQMRHFLRSNMEVFAEVSALRRDLIDTNVHQIEADKRIDKLFALMDKYNVNETQGVFFQGQIFDAYAKFESFIKRATKSIVLIDNYVDLSVLERLARKKKGVQVTVFTHKKSGITLEDVQKFNVQYPLLTVKRVKSVHDRFLIVDQSHLYHIGASLKDLGKKCFAFELLDCKFIPLILNSLESE